MRAYLIQRLCLMIPTLLGITLVVYAVLLLLPGDPVDVLLAEAYGARMAKQLRAEWGLDDPVIVQYGRWLWRIVQGDWGHSLFSRRPVFDEIVGKLPLTLELIALACLVQLVIAVPAGVIAAVKPSTWWDYGAVTMAVVGVSMPPFLLGIVLFLTFGLWLGWLPVQGYVPLRDSVIQNLRHLLLPSLALGVAQTAILTRLIRSSLLEVMRTEYVTTARAKGLVEAIVITKHALKNALIPAVTVLGLQVGYLVGGSIIIEVLFALPGLGSYGIEAIRNRDYPQVLGFILVSALGYQAANLSVDILYCFLDPRIRYGKADT